MSNSRLSRFAHRARLVTARTDRRRRHVSSGVDIDNDTPAHLTGDDLVTEFFHPAERFDAADPVEPIDRKFARQAFPGGAATRCRARNRIDADQTHTAQDKRKYGRGQTGAASIAARRHRAAGCSGAEHARQHVTTDGIDGASPPRSRR